jgi:hypothetical protein
LEQEGQPLVGPSFPWSQSGADAQVQLIGHSLIFRDLIRDAFPGAQRPDLFFREPNSRQHLVDMRAKLRRWIVLSPPKKRPQLIGDAALPVLSFVKVYTSP